MTTYEDTTVALDDEGLTIKGYRWLGDERRIDYGSILGHEVFEMGLWSGKFRVVGIGFGRPRDWFSWSRSRTNKTTAISLDVGRLIRPTIVPDDPAGVDAILDTVTSRP